MTKPVPYLNEIVSLTVMLLMIIALVAGQAEATAGEEPRARGVPAAEQRSEAPFNATIRAEIDGKPLTISIDASAEFEYFRPEDE